jgi:protein-S-isoprenylcysteine O-methyltransferase Ste14
MNTATKLKLLMPVLYSVLAAAFFALTWPNSPTPNHYVGLFITFIAFALWIVARVQLGNSFSIGAKANHLITAGLYSKLRHPVYYFSILAVVGLGVYVWSVFVLIPLVFLTALEIYRINNEEKVLSDKFGKAYSEYKSKTWF